MTLVLFYIPWKYQYDLFCNEYINRDLFLMPSYIRICDDSFMKGTFSLQGFVQSVVLRS